MGLLICRLISFIAIDSIIIDCIGRSAFKVRGWKRTWQRWMLPTLEFFFSLLFSVLFCFVLVFLDNFILLLDEIIILGPITKLIW